MLRLYIASLIFYLGLLFSSAAGATENILRVLAWPGYADGDVVKTFETRFHAKVEVTLVDSDEALWDKMHSGTVPQFDVLAANTVEIQRYTHESLLTPLDLSQLPNTQRQLPRFRALSSIGGLIDAGKIYAIPFTYSSMGLIYDRKQIPLAPHSMSALWDPQYKGKVLAFNSAQHNFSFTALAMGYANPFQLSPAQIKLVTQKMIATRRNLLTYYNLPEEATELFVQHKAALMFGNYGTQQMTSLRLAGADVGYVIPDEGALAWLDCWAMTRSVVNRALALDWINFMLEPSVSGLLTQRQGLANTLTVSLESSDTGHIVWLQPVEDIQNREALWSRIVSGDRPESF